MIGTATLLTLGAATLVGLLLPDQPPILTLDVDDMPDGPIIQNGTLL